METNRGGNYKGPEGQTSYTPPPRLEFSILKNPINLEDVLSSDIKKRPSVFAVYTLGTEYENKNPGDLAARTLVDGLHRSHVTIEEYIDTMPGLLEMAAKEGGGFDKDFIAVTLFQFDHVAHMMKLPGGIRLGSPNFNEVRNRREYFQRAYGRIEAYRSLIWDDPVARPIKQDRIQRANEVLAEQRPRFPHSLF